MVSESSVQRSIRKVTWSVLLTITALLFTFSFVSAALYVVDTNNNLSTDWSGIPVFLTDPKGDLNTAGNCSDASSNDDIVSVKVASGYLPGEPQTGTPTHIFFQVLTDGQNAFNTQQHWVEAFMDCPPAGTATQDIQLIYRGYLDTVVLGDGKNPVGSYVDYGTSGPEGERPTDLPGSVEWRGPFSDMVNYTCSASTTVNLQIISYKVRQTLQGFVLDCIYDSTEWKGFNIPTAVKLNSLNANSNRTWLIISVVTFGVAILTGVAGLSIYLRKKS